MTVFGHRSSSFRKLRALWLAFHRSLKKVSPERSESWELIGSITTPAYLIPTQKCVRPNSISCNISASSLLPLSGHHGIQYVCLPISHRTSTVQNGNQINKLSTRSNQQPTTQYRTIHNRTFFLHVRIHLVFPTLL